MGPKMGNMPPPHRKPLGYSSLPRDVVNAPVHWIDKVYNLVWLKEHKRGGHFAFLEHPDVLWADLEEYVEYIWGHEQEVKPVPRL